MGNLPHNFNHCRVFQKGICQLDGKVCNLMSKGKLWCADYKQKRRLENGIYDV